MGLTWGNTGGHPKLKLLEINSSPGKTPKTSEKIHKLDQTQASGALGTNMDPQNKTT